MRRVCAVGFGMLLVVGAGGSAAYAATATTAGAKSVNVNTEYLQSWDTANDSQWTSAPWQSNWGSSGSVLNQAGFGTIVGQRVVGGGEKIRNIRACRSNTALPMSCGAWVATGY